MNHSLQEIAKSFSEEYMGKRGNYELFVELLRNELEALAEEHKIEVLQTTGRTKEPDKVESKILRKNYGKPSDDLRDLAGVRVDTIFEADILPLVEIFRTKYEKVFEFSNPDSGLKRDAMDPDQFGYQSFHLVFRVQKENAQPPWDRHRNQWAELQIRSTLQTGWAKVSHKIDYKGTAAPPRAIRRRLNAVSALLEIADSSFDDLRRDVETLKGRYMELLEQGKLGEIDLDDLSLYLALTNDDTVRTMPLTLDAVRDLGVEVGMQAFEGYQVDRISVGRLALTLRHLNVPTLGAFWAVLKDLKSTAQERLKLFLERVQQKGGFFAADSVDLLTVLVSMEARDKCWKDHLPSNYNWSGESMEPPQSAVLEALQSVSGLEAKSAQSLGDGH